MTRYICWLLVLFPALGTMSIEDACAKGDQPTTECDEQASPFGGGDGRPDDPYRLCSPEHLNTIGDGNDHLDAAFVVVRDIDMAGVDDYNVIGDQGGAGPQFSGNFDGNGHTIANLTIDSGSREAVGLFGSIGEDGVVENVTLEGVDVTGAGGVGGLAGLNEGGEIRGVSVSGRVEGNVFVGGLVGHNGGTIVDSNTEATTEGNMDVGGLVGSLRDDGEIVESHAAGNVRAVGEMGGGTDVGGMAGSVEKEANVEGSYATASVEGTRNVGGLVGQNAGSVATSHATGDVNGERAVGGLVGQNFKGEVDMSYATGSVEGKEMVGGLVGDNESVHFQQPAQINRSYALGDVEGRDAVGGLVGESDASNISESYAAAGVDGQKTVGGLVGDFEKGKLDSSYWDATASGTSESDGGSGLDTEEFGEASSFEGWDFDEVWQIGTAPDGKTRPIHRREGD